MMDKQQDRTILAEGRHIRLVSRSGWEYVERVKISGIVAILAVTEDGRILLTEQYRKPVEKRVIELPAGLAGDVVGDEGEALAEAARRELLEETGYKAGRMIYLTQGPPSAGLSTEIITLFRALDLRKESDGGGDASEDITVHEVPVERAGEWLEEMSRKGLLIDPKVYTGLYFVSVARRDSRNRNE